MALILKRKYELSMFCENKEQTDKLIRLIKSFRIQINDLDKDKNLLNGKKEECTDGNIVMFLKEGTKDINRGSNNRDYTIFTFPDESLVVKSAIIMYLIATGLLQLRNQVDFNDSGFTMQMFNKTGTYQAWASFYLQTYIQDKNDFYSREIFSNDNGGFVEIISEFGYGIIE